MKAIIIAAGRGRRMAELTVDRPKCLLDINGKHLLDIQLEAMKENGIEDISIVVGYKKEKIKYPKLKYYVNDRYEHNNILHSLFYAREEMADGFVATYCDIIYGPNVVRELLDGKGEISILVDTDWKKHYEGRNDHPMEEAESVVFGDDRNVVRIGKKIPKNSANGEFVGMVKCTRAGAKVFREHFNALAREYDGKPFHEAPMFEKAYVTDMIQDMVDSGIKVHCVTIRGGWQEIDTIEDYNKALKCFGAWRAGKIQA